MSAKKKPNLSPIAIERIKELVVIAMFSDDELMDRLVLKGGNALDLIHRVSVRASLDVDFSMGDDFKADQLKDILNRVERALVTTFQTQQLVAFDVTLSERPPNITPDMADFWGGYQIEFKLIGKEKHDQFGGDFDSLRRNALLIGPSSKFLIEISRHEYIADKKTQYLDGHRIFVYSAEMIVGEKLRAICQQMPEYGPIIKRKRRGAARARDFVDIHTLVIERKINLNTASNWQLLTAIFKAKKVPIDLLKRIDAYRDFHQPDFASVKATVKAGVRLQEFDYYFDFVLDLVGGLEPLRNK